MRCYVRSQLGTNPLGYRLKQTLNSSVRIFEIVSLKNSFKPLSPEQLRVKSLKDQMKSKQAALKRERE
jgi:hypothetical protein